MYNFSKPAIYISRLLFITLLFAASGCQLNERDESPVIPTYQDISAAELQIMLDEGEDLLLVDVREEHEYAVGHIPGAVLLILGDLEEDYGVLDHQKTIVLICRSGRRSAEGARFLVQQGFEKVYNLQGGMLSWTGQIEEIQLH